MVSNEYKPFIREKSPQVVDEIFQIPLGYTQETITKLTIERFRLFLPGIEETEEKLRGVKI